MTYNLDSTSFTGTSQRIRLETQFNSISSDFIFIDDILITAVPEPSSLALLGLVGLAGLVILRRRKK